MLKPSCHIGQITSIHVNAIACGILSSTLNIYDKRGGETTSVSKLIFRVELLRNQMHDPPSVTLQVSKTLPSYHLQLDHSLEEYLLNCHRFITRQHDAMSSVV